MQENLLNMFIVQYHKDLLICFLVQNHLKFCMFKKKFLNFMAPFYGWRSTASRLEPLQGGSLVFTTKFPETGTH